MTHGSSVPPANTQNPLGGLGGQRMRVGHMYRTLGALMQMPHIHVARVPLGRKHCFRDGRALGFMDVVPVHVAAQQETAGVQIVNGGPVAHKV